MVLELIFSYNFNKCFCGWKVLLLCYCLNINMHKSIGVNLKLMVKINLFVSAYLSFFFDNSISDFAFYNLLVLHLQEFSTCIFHLNLIIIFIFIIIFFVRILVTFKRRASIYLFRGVFSRILILVLALRAIFSLEKLRCHI